VSGVLSADRIGTAAHHDPQLRTPARPRLRRGLVVEHLDGQAVVSGVPKRQRFQGRLATELLPRLWPLLDGTRDHEALAAEIEVAPETVFRVVSLLWASGIVEEAGPEERPDVTDGVADYLSRLGDATGANAAWEEAAVRWLATPVEVFGDPECAAALVAQLADLGALPTVGATGPAPGTRLAVVLDSPGAPDPSGVIAACWERGVPVVWCRVDAEHVQVGPYVHPALTPCLTCQVAVRADDAAPAGDPDPAALELATSLLAREVAAVVTRATPSHLPSRWRLLRLDDLHAVEHVGATRPGCPACSVAGGPAVDAPLAVRYEASVAMPPKEFADTKAHQAHYQPTNLALQQRFRAWPGSPRTVLPDPDLARLATADAAPARTDLTAGDLVTLLTIAAGVQAVTPDRVLRWTAAGGNIGSVVAHVVVRDVPGVPPGVHAWLPEQGLLAHLHDDPGAVPGTAPATAVLVGDFVKVARKYGAFALRIVQLDSGCAQAALWRTGRALGVRVRRRSSWDDVAVGAAVGARAASEPVTAVIDLGGPA
jgi:hypothetical protein